MYYYTFQSLLYYYIAPGLKQVVHVSIGRKGGLAAHTKNRFFAGLPINLKNDYEINENIMLRIDIFRK